MAILIRKNENNNGYKHQLPRQKVQKWTDTTQVDYSILF
jgi:hypothetical protein